MTTRFRSMLVLATGLIAIAAVACGSDDAAPPTQVPTTPVVRPTLEPTTAPFPPSTATNVPSPELSPAAEALADAKVLWTEAGLTNYSFGFNWSCFCIRDYVAAVDIQVVDGDIASAEYTDPEFVGQETDLSRYETVDDLFDILEEAIDRNAVTINAEYDADLGYPTTVFIDYDQRIADEERGFAVSGVTPQ